MKVTKGSTQSRKSRFGVRTTAIGVSAPPLPSEHSSLGLMAQMVMQEAIGTMQPGDGLSRWHVKLSYGRNSDTILITLEARHTMQQLLSPRGGPRTWWSRLVSATTFSTTKSPFDRNLEKIRREK